MSIRGQVGKRCLVNNLDVGRKVCKLTELSQDELDKLGLRRAGPVISPTFTLIVKTSLHGRRIGWSSFLGRLWQRGEGFTFDLIF